MYTKDTVDDYEVGLGRMLDGEMHNRHFHDFNDRKVYSLCHEMNLVKYRRYSRKNGKLSFVYENEIVGHIMARLEGDMPIERIIDIDLRYSEILIRKQHRRTGMIF